MSPDHCSPQQRTKAGLLEVMVARGRLRQATIRHDHEGCAVGERPVFVLPVEIQIQRPPKQSGIGQDDFNARVTGEALVKFLEEVPFAVSGQRVRNFGDDPGGRDERAIPVVGVVDGAFVRDISGIDGGEKEERVGKYRVHFASFGEPWM